MELIAKEHDKYRITHSFFSYQCPVAEAGQHREQTY